MKRRSVIIYLNTTLLMARRGHGKDSDKIPEPIGKALNPSSGEPMESSQKFPYQILNGKKVARERIKSIRRTYRTKIL